MRFDPFVFANVCVAIAGGCYLLACAGFLYARLWLWAGVWGNYACANTFLIVIAMAAARRA